MAPAEICASNQRSSIPSVFSNSSILQHFNNGHTFKQLRLFYFHRQPLHVRISVSFESRFPATFPATLRMWKHRPEGEKQQLPRRILQSTPDFNLRGGEMSPLCLSTHTHTHTRQMFKDSDRKNSASGHDLILKTVFKFWWNPTLRACVSMYVRVCVCCKRREGNGLVERVKSDPK